MSTQIKERENSVDIQLCWRPLPPFGADLGVGFQLYYLICIKLTAEARR